MLKRRTLLMLVVAAGVALALGLVFRLQQRPLSGPMRTVAFGGASLPVPAGWGEPVANRHERWERLTLGPRGHRLLLAWEPADPRLLPEAYTRWFALPAYTPGPLRYRGEGSRRFFREIPLAGQGAYALQRRGKGLVLVAAFAQGGRHYWIQMESPQAGRHALRDFHALLLGLRLPDGSTPGTGLASVLATIPAECGWEFALPLGFFLLLPLGVILLVTGVQSLVGWRAGRLPDQAPGRLEGHLEIAFRRPMQIQYLDVALGVTGEALTFYTFGTPFLVVPRQNLQGRVGTGRGWFGAGYVELDLPGPLDLRKWAWKFAATRGARVRIYTSDPLSLQQLLA